MEKQNPVKKKDVLKAVLKKGTNSIKIHPASDDIKVLMEQYFPKNLIGSETLVPDIRDKLFPVRIVQWQTEDFFDKCTLIQEYLKATNSELLPVIHILADTILPDTDLLNSHLPRYAKLMDSSIWNYCIWGDDFNNDTALQRTKRAIDCIWHNWEKGYYMTAQAVEYADLNARISQQSYIVGQHERAVVPFIFHSEYYTWKRHIEPKDADTFCHNYQWRFLLLDDFAIKSLNRYRKTDQKTSHPDLLPTKLDIVLDRLLSVKGMRVMYKKTETDKWSAVGDASENNFHIAIECVTCIDDLLERIGSKRYDVILLDYLLGEKGVGREYSYELFKELEERKDTLKIGPDNCLYFIFISSFVHAIQERLEEQHISRNDEKWFIGRGACPLNTPEIFLYNLHRCMEKKIMAMRHIDKVPDLLNGLFKSAANNSADFVENCRSKFVELLNFIMSLDRLRRNDLSGTGGLDGTNSVLAASMLKKGIPEPDFWEHLQHLCYMISFEPESRWPEWWEEYLFVRERLQKFGSQDTNSAACLKSFITGISKIK